MFYVGRFCPACGKGFKEGDYIIVLKAYVIQDGNPTRLADPPTDTWYHAGCFVGVLEAGLPSTPTG